MSEPDKHEGWLWCSKLRRLIINGEEMEIQDGMTIQYVRGNRPFILHQWPLAAFDKYNTGPVACLLSMEGPGEEREGGPNTAGPVFKAALPMKVVATMDVSQLLVRWCFGMVRECFGVTGFPPEVETYLAAAVTAKEGRTIGNGTYDHKWVELQNAVISLRAQYEDRRNAALRLVARLQEEMRVKTVETVVCLLKDDIRDMVTGVMRWSVAVKTAADLLREQHAREEEIAKGLVPTVGVDLEAGTEETRAYVDQIHYEWVKIANENMDGALRAAMKAEGVVSRVLPS